jgi:plastocyanin
MAASTIALFTVLLAATAFAAPTNTIHERWTGTVAATGVTHTVVAGFNGLNYEPNNIVANPGDIVEWHFLAKNHSVAQSSFAEPCKPLNIDQGSQGFFSGFNFVTAPGAQNVSRL